MLTHSKCSFSPAASPCSLICVHIYEYSMVRTLSVLSEASFPSFFLKIHVALFSDLFWPQKGVLRWKRCTKNFVEKKGKVALSLWKLLTDKNWNRVLQIFAHLKKTFWYLEKKKSSPLTFQAIVLPKGRLREPTVCHSEAGRLHYSRAADPGSREKNVVLLLLLWGFYSNCVLDHPAPDVQFTEEKPYAFICGAMYVAAQIRVKLWVLSVGAQERNYDCSVRQSLCDATRKPLVWCSRDWWLVKGMHTKLSWGRQKTQLSFICASYSGPSDLEGLDPQRNESYTYGW